MTGNGCSNPANNERLLNGMFTLIVDPERLPAELGFGREVTQFIDFVKSSRRLPGCDEILLPGEIEQRTAPAEAGKRYPAGSKHLGVDLRVLQIGRCRCKLSTLSFSAPNLAPRGNNCESLPKLPRSIGGSPVRDTVTR